MRAWLIHALEAENGESRPPWKPLHMQSAFVHAPSNVVGTSGARFGAGLCMPSGSMLTHDDLDRIRRRHSEDVRLIIVRP